MFEPREDNIYDLPAESMSLDFNKLHIDNYKQVESVSFIVRGCPLVVTTPNRLGNVVFWKNWRWYNHYLDTVIRIVMLPDSDPPSVQVRLVEIDCKRDVAALKHEHIYIPSQTNTYPEYEGTPYNNTLLSAGDILSLKYGS